MRLKAHVGVIRNIELNKSVPSIDIACAFCQKYDFPMQKMFQFIVGELGG